MSAAFVGVPRGKLAEHVLLLQDTDISPSQRDEAVRWLMELHRRLQLYPETLALAVSIMDRFLAAVKVQAAALPRPCLFSKLYRYRGMETGRQEC